jgi:hypothetical protein
MATGPPRGDGGRLPTDEQTVWERIGAEFSEHDAVEVTRAAGTAAYEELVSRRVIGDFDLAQLPKVNRSRVSQRVTERSLYSFLDSGEQRCYPSWQFTDGKTIPGLKTVLAQIDSDLHPLTVDRWFNRPDVDLVADGISLTPVEWLSSGGSPELAADHACFL